MENARAEAVHFRDKAASMEAAVANEMLFTQGKRLLKEGDLRRERKDGAMASEMYETAATIFSQLCELSAMPLQPKVSAVNPERQRLEKVRQEAQQAAETALWEPKSLKTAQNLFAAFEGKEGATEPLQPIIKAFEAVVDEVKEEQMLMQQWGAELASLSAEAEKVAAATYAPTLLKTAQEKQEQIKTDKNKEGAAADFEAARAAYRQAVKESQEAQEQAQASAKEEAPSEKTEPVDVDKVAEIEAGTIRKFAGIEFVWCPPGTFLMGSPATEPEREADENQQKVTFEKGFWLSRFETIQWQWKEVMGETPSAFVGTNRPVDSVGWDEMQQFIEKLNQEYGGGFRLPTEAEWEYGCRAGTTTPFHYGATLSSAQANYNGTISYNNGQVGEFRQSTTNIGSFPPNAWGLYDMHGNVCEWCQDRFDSETDDSLAPGLESHVLRGGAWNYEPRYCRAAFRDRRTPHMLASVLGFRLARDANEG